MGCSPIKAVRELGLERRNPLRPQGVIPECSPAHIGETLIVTPELYFEGNTEGRPAIEVKACSAPYVAGFLDGDGSIHFQLVRQSGYRFGYYIRASVSFSQATTARWGLEILQASVGGGYVRDRGTGMSDLVVTSRPLIHNILVAVEPYVIFKREHVKTALQLLPRIQRNLTPEEFLAVARDVDAFASLNYSKRKRITAEAVERHLRSKGCCAPVTTSPIAQWRDGIRP